MKGVTSFAFAFLTITLCALAAADDCDHAFALASQGTCAEASDAYSTKRAQCMTENAHFSADKIRECELCSQEFWDLSMCWCDSEEKGGCGITQDGGVVNEYLLKCSDMNDGLLQCSSASSLAASASLIVVGVIAMLAL